MPTPAEYWEITDENGNIFEFKKRQLSRYEFPAPPPAGGNFFNYVSAWFITKITTVNGREIDFIYDPEPSINVIGLSMFSVNWNVLDGEYSYQESLNEYTPVYIQEISFDNGRVYFQNSGLREDLENGYKLDKIQIYNSDELLKEFEFSYDYFVATPNQYQQDLSNSNYKSRLQAVSGYSEGEVTNIISERSRKRLKLDSLQEISSGVSKPPYLFTYNSINLPCKNSFSVDHWGYFNNAPNSNKIPSFANYASIMDGNGPITRDFFQFNNANRQPNNNAKAALLELMTYPTGGSLTLDYELNSYEVDITKPVTLASFEPYVVQDQTHEVHFDNEETHQFVTTQNDIYGGVNMEVRFTFAYAGGSEECDRYGIRIDDSQGNFVYYHDIELGSFACEYSTPFPVTHVVNYDIGVLSSNEQYSVQLIDNFPQLDSDPSYVTIPIDIDVTFSYSQIKRRTEGNGGGCRISRIENFDPITGKTVIKTLQYFDGKLITPPIYARKVNFFQLVLDTGGECLERAPMERILISSASNTAGSNSLNGSHVGYDKVIEYAEDASGNSINKTEYNYLNNEDTPAESVDFGPFIPPFSNKENGLLKSKIEYDESDRIIRQTDNYYLVSLEPINYGMKIFYKRLPQGTCQAYILEPPIILINLVFYKYFIERQLLTKVDVTTDGVTQTTNYYYDNINHNNPSRIQKNTSYGNDIWLHTLYPDDYSVTTGFIGDMKTTNIINNPIEQYSVKNNKVIDGTLITYNTGSQAGLQDKVYRIQIDEPLSLGSPNFVPSNINGGFSINWYYNPDNPEVIFDLYDNFGNLLQYHTKDNITISYIWGYSYTYPIAKIENASFDEVVSALGRPPGDDLSYLQNFSDLHVRTEIDMIRTNLPDALVTTYTYKPLVGMTSQTDPKGVTTYYEYDDFGRLERILDDDRNILKEYEYRYQGQ